MRVVLITDEGPDGPGGVATWVGAVAGGLAAAGHEVTLCDRLGGPPIPGVRRRPVGGPSFGRWGGVWTVARAGGALARADRVIAATWPVATQVVRLGLDVSVVAHGSDVTRPPRDPRGLRRVLDRATRWFAVSRWLADRVPRETAVLPAPIDPGAPGPLHGSWVFVGRAVPGKGGDTFVRWVAEARAEGLLVGDGPALPAWRALARDLGARVTFAGRLPSAAVRDRLRGAALLAVPSAAPEGFGLVAVEAAALGVPAVGTDAGGLPEALGPAGLVVPASPVEAVARIRDWWTPTRGDEARDWCAATHGVARTVEALLVRARPGCGP